MKKNVVYGVFFDIRNFAYVCPAPAKEDLTGAYLITGDERKARETAWSLNAARHAKAVVA